MDVTSTEADIRPVRVAAAVTVIVAVEEPQTEPMALDEVVVDCVSDTEAQDDAEALLLPVAVTEALDVGKGEPEFVEVTGKLAEATPERVAIADAVIFAVAELQAELGALGEDVTDCVSVAVAQGDAEPLLLKTEVNEALAVIEGEPELVADNSMLIEARNEPELVVDAMSLEEAPPPPERCTDLVGRMDLMVPVFVTETLEDSEIVPVLKVVDEAQAELVRLKLGERVAAGDREADGDRVLLNEEALLPEAIDCVGDTVRETMFVALIMGDMEAEAHWLCIGEKVSTLLGDTESEETADCDNTALPLGTLPDGSRESVPLLEEVTELVGDEVGQTVEVKEPLVVLLWQPLELRLCDSDDVKVGLPLCERDMVPLPENEAVSEVDGDAVVLAQKEPLPVFETEPQPLVLKETRPVFETELLPLLDLELELQPLLLGNPLPVLEIVLQPLLLNEPLPVFEMELHPLLVLEAELQLLLLGEPLPVLEIVLQPLLLKETLPVFELVPQAEALKLPEGLVLAELVLLLL